MKPKKNYLIPVFSSLDVTLQGHEIVLSVSVNNCYCIHVFKSLVHKRHYLHKQKKGAEY